MSKSVMIENVPGIDHSVKPGREEELLKELKLDQKPKLNKHDKVTLAKAARAISKQIRKINPELARHLYYVWYKNKSLIGGLRSVN